MLLSLLAVNYMSLFNWVLTTSAKASIFIVFLLGVKFVFKHRMGAHFQYMLWSVLLLGLVLPWTPSSPVSVNNFINSPHLRQIVAPSFNSTPQSTAAASVTKQSDLEQTVADSDSGKAALGRDKQLTGSNNTVVFDLLPFIYKLMFWIWFLGILTLTVFIVVVNKRFSNRIEHDLVTDPGQIAVFNQLKAELKIKTEIPLFKTSEVNSPALWGVIHPKLLLPLEIEQTFSLEQITQIFLHELLHFKRKDIVINWLTQVLVIIHWFNPLIWYAFYRMKEEQEISCDALVIGRLTAAQAHDYPYILIKLVETYSNTPRLVSLTSLFASQPQIKRRLIMIKKSRQVSVKWSLLGLLVVGLIAFAVFSSAKAEALSLVPKIEAAVPAPIIDVNSMSPVPLNKALVEYAGKNKEGEYPYSNENDLASIVVGNDQTDDALAAMPLFVKSYAEDTGDYYIVPFVRNQKFVKIAVVKPLSAGKAVIAAEGSISPCDKFLDVDAQEAMTIMKQAKGVGSVPAPRLVFYREPSNPSQALNNIKEYLVPYWEFEFSSQTRSYVTQAKQVVTKDIAPWYETYITPEYTPQALQIEANKLIRDDGWMLKVTKITLAASPYDKNNGNYPGRGFEAYFSLESTSGKEKGFIPQGKILGIVGASGKLYELTWPESLDQLYIKMQRSLPGLAIKEGNPYEPGIFKIAAGAKAEATEEAFTKVIYEDEKGNKFEIPIQGITPELTYPNPNAK